MQYLLIWGWIPADRITSLNKSGYALTPFCTQCYELSSVKRLKGLGVRVGEYQGSCSTWSFASDSIIIDHLPHARLRGYKQDMPCASGSSELGDAARIRFHSYEQLHKNYVEYNKKFLQEMCVGVHMPISERMQVCLLKRSLWTWKKENLSLKENRTNSYQDMCRL